MMKNVFILFISMLFVCISAQSQWGPTVGENVQLTSGEGLKLNVLIEPGPDDSWYISYTVATGSNTNVVHLSRVDSTGVILWDNIIHDLSDVGNPRAVMVPDMSDGVIMAWIDRRVPTDPMVYANRIDVDGNKLWGDTDLQVGMTEGEQSCVKLVTNDNGGAIVTCRDETPGNDEFTGIYAHSLGASGTVDWRTYIFPNGNDCGNYSICRDGEGGVVAFTTYGHALEMENQVRGMRLDGNGVKVWDDETFVIGPISLPIGMEFQGSQDSYADPRVAFHPSAGIYLVYYHNPIGGSDPDHKGQLIDLDGNKQWADEDVPLNEPSSLSPEVMMLTDLDGSLYFNYHTETHWELQKVLSDGSLPWTVDGVEYSSDQTGAPDNLDLTTCNDVMTAVDGVDGVIHATRIDSNGDMVYNPALLPLSLFDLEYIHRDPVIRVNENDRVIAVWAVDDNEEEWDLRMHGFHKDGDLGNATSLQDLELIDFEMYPNPLSISNAGFLRVRSDEIAFGNVSLVNANGSTVLEQNNLDFRGGIVDIAIPAELSGGIYSLQITDGNRLLTRKLVVY